MADKRDCYEILGISKDATDDQIKKAYRSMAKKYHPDANPNDKTAEEKFKEVNEAYSILSDPDKKARYDSYGYAGVDPTAAGFDGGFGGFGGGFDMGDIFGDIFGGMFGGGGRRSNPNAPSKGSDVSLRITISFEEAAFGCKKDISYTRIEGCSECGGSGAKKGTSATTCQRCGGRGRINVQQRTPFGVMQSTSDCPECGGKGRIIKEPCGECRGRGTVKKNKKLEVSIPAGIDNGQRVLLHGQGNAGSNGGPAGDLGITVMVREHSLFERDGVNIYLEMPVSFTDAALGAKIVIPTLEGSGELTIPEGTQSGSTFAVKGRGIPYVNGKGRGDLLVTVNVEVPKSLSKKQRRALEDFAESCDEKNYPKRKSFSDKIKKL